MKPEHLLSKLWQAISSGSKHTLTAFTPQQCLLCYASSEDQQLCHSCHELLVVAPSCCEQCGKQLPVAAKCCGQCQSSPPLYQKLLNAYFYDDNIAHIISQFKYQHQFAAGRFIANALSNKILNSYDAQALPEAILPVPLHNNRLRQRGFDQAQWLAQYIQQKIKIPLLLNHCSRIRETQAQATLHAKQRLTNVKNAFKITQTIPSNIAIVDDVVTTGATINSLIKTLKQSGVQTIHVWCVART